jgi:regulatory protein
VVKPLDPPRLEELALAYVARFATSAGKLAQYLKRKLRERGWEALGDSGAPPDVAALIERFVDAGYVDDAGFARGRASSLHRRGYGDRRVEQALRGAGIADDVRASVQGDEAESRRAALVLARKRRFGPFGAEPLDPAKRQKQFAAMLRAGHPLDSVRVLIDAASEAEALEWVDEVAGESDT